MYEAISVVIPTIPERKEQLAKLLKQLGSKFEVIVVDNQELSLAEKRNYGLAQATGDLIYFLDDDNELFLDTFVDLALIMECNLKVGIAASVAVNGGKFVDEGLLEAIELEGFQVINEDDENPRQDDADQQGQDEDDYPGAGLDKLTWIKLVTISE